MQNKATTPKQYIDALPADRKKAVSKLRSVIKRQLPRGFKEVISYNMLGYVVPHSLYPSGYHCNTDLPLPFINIASQKNYIAVYHMGLYSDAKLMNWFVKSYENSGGGKLDMGKSCIRFKNIDAIPYSLLGELAGKITPAKWIETYEASIGTSRKKSNTGAKKVAKRTTKKITKKVTKIKSKKPATSKKTTKKTSSKKITKNARKSTPGKKVGRSGAKAMSKKNA